MIPARSFLLLVTFVSSTAYAYNPTYGVMTEVAWTGTCGRGTYTPIPNAFFPSTDSSANIYFEIDNVQTSDVVSEDWLDPTNQVHSGAVWSSGSGGRCYFDAWTIGGALPGPWHVRIYVNGTKVFDLPFTIGASVIQPRAPSYTGSFDAVDCTHIYGWAEDTNNVTATVSVDIFVDGNFWATIAAGDYRVDLATAGIGNHAFNEYFLPPNLHDGNQHSVRITYSETSTDLPGSTKAFQNTCGAVTPGSLSANWVAGSPPATMVSGQTYSLNWQVSGGNQIQSRVCYGTSATTSFNVNTLCQQQVTAWQTSVSALLTATLTAPIVTGVAPVTYYFVAQAQAGGQTVYSPVGSSLDTGTTIGPSNVQTWIYDSSKYSQLSRFSIRLDKEHLAAGKYQYRISVTPDYNSIHSLDSAQLILLRPNAVTFDHQNSQILINHDTVQQILGSPALNWQAPPSPYGGPPHFVQVMLDIVGLLSPEVGTIQGLSELANDLSSADPTVGPSPWFEGMMNDDNNYHVNRLFLGQQVHLFGFNGTYGIRFVITEVDESSGQAPQFLVIAKDSGGVIVGAEIGLDRNILASRAQGKSALQYIIVF